MTNNDLIDFLKENMSYEDKHCGCPLYCDSAEPQRIKEIQDAGFNALPSDKSVKDGIDFCKRLNIITNPNNIHTITLIIKNCH